MRWSIKKWLVKLFEEIVVYFIKAAVAILFNAK